MEAKEKLVAALDKWAKKVETPNYKDKFQGFDKSLLFTFTDQAFNLHMVFKDGTCTLKEGAIPNPDIEIITQSDVILGITSGEINAMKAFLTRKLKAKGDRAAMLKVQLLMK